MSILYQIPSFHPDDLEKGEGDKKRSKIEEKVSRFHNHLLLLVEEEV